MAYSYSDIPGSHFNVKVVIWASRPRHSFQKRFWVYNTNIVRTHVRVALTWKKISPRTKKYHGNSAADVYTQLWPEWVISLKTLQWRHNERDGVSNHQPHDCLFNRLFRRRSNNTSKLRASGLCAGYSLVTGEFPAQRASDRKCFHFTTSSWLEKKTYSQPWSFNYYLMNHLWIG